MYDPTIKEFHLALSFNCCKKILNRRNAVWYNHMTDLHRISTDHISRTYGDTTDKLIKLKSRKVLSSDKVAKQFKYRPIYMVSRSIWSWFEVKGKMNSINFNNNYCFYEHVLSLLFNICIYNLLRFYIYHHTCFGRKKNRTSIVIFRRQGKFVYL